MPPFPCYLVYAGWTFSQQPMQERSAVYINPPPTQCKWFRVTAPLLRFRSLRGSCCHVTSVTNGLWDEIVPPDTVRDISQDVALLSAPSPTFAPRPYKKNDLCLHFRIKRHKVGKGWSSHSVTCRAQSILGYCPIPLSGCTGWLPSYSSMIAANAESTGCVIFLFLHGGKGVGSLETLIGCLESTGGD
jgi:hypothetical protein